MIQYDTVLYRVVTKIRYCPKNEYPNNFSITLQYPSFRSKLSVCVLLCVLRLQLKLGVHLISRCRDMVGARDELLGYEFVPQ
jgi:hypothetical protein